jgi:hypothetical protein
MPVIDGEVCYEGDQEAALCLADHVRLLATQPHLRRKAVSRLGNIHLQNAPSRSNHALGLLDPEVTPANLGSICERVVGFGWCRNPLWRRLGSRRTGHTDVQSDLLE